MELSQTEPFRVFDHHNSRIRDVDSDFDHRCRNKHVDIARGKGTHYSFFLFALQATVEKRDLTIREYTRQFCRTLGRRFQIHLLGLFDDRIDNVTLPSFPHLCRKPAVNLLGIAFRGVHRLDWRPTRRHFIDYGAVSYTHLTLPTS